MPADKPEGILSVSTEKRVFKPAKPFSARARVRSLAEYKKLYNESIRSPEKFWDKQAKNELVWFKPWRKVLDWKEPFANWFIGGQLIVSQNCLDKWLGSSLSILEALILVVDRAALVLAGEERT